MNPIEIDGSSGEGGGAVLRIASALASITGNSLHIFNIRKSRPKGGGLEVQHLKGLEAITELCNGRLENAGVGSKEIWFYPGKIQAKDLHIKIETAGSITLVLQTLILPALFTRATAKGGDEAMPSSTTRAAAKTKRTSFSSLPSPRSRLERDSVGEEETLVSSPASKPIKIIFDGGATDTFFSPTIDYFQFVFLKILAKMKLAENGSPLAEVNVLRRGYYPEGGARVEVKIYPSKLKILNLTERGSLKKILVISGAANALKDKKVSERQIAGVREVLGKLKLPTEEKIEYYDSRCPGSQVCLIAEFENTIIGTDNLGKLGKRAEDVGKEAALGLLKEQKSNACLDKHLADQILPFLAITKNRSKITVSEITNHCKTNIWVIEKFIPGKFEIEDNLISWTPKKN